MIQLKLQTLEGPKKDVVQAVKDNDQSRLSKEENPAKGVYGCPAHKELSSISVVFLFHLAFLVLWWGGCLQDFLFCFGFVSLMFFC